MHVNFEQQRAVGRKRNDVAALNTRLAGLDAMLQVEGGVGRMVRTGQAGQQFLGGAAIPHPGEGVDHGVAPGQVELGDDLCLGIAQLSGEELALGQLRQVPQGLDLRRRHLARCAVVDGQGAHRDTGLVADRIAGIKTEIRRALHQAMAGELGIEPGVLDDDRFASRQRALAEARLQVQLVDVPALHRLEPQLALVVQGNSGYRNVERLLCQPRQPVKARVQRRVEDCQRMNVGKPQGFGMGEGSLEHGGKAL